MHPRAMLLAALFLPQIVTSYPPSSASGSFDGNVTGQLSLQADTSPANITADQDNFDCDIDTNAVCRVTGDTSFRAIRGLADGADGRTVKLCNVGTNSLWLPDDGNTAFRSSTAGNRFAFGGTDVPLFKDSCIDLYYDSTTARWRSVTSALMYGTSMPTRFGIHAREVAANSTTAATPVLALVNQTTGLGAAGGYIMSTDDDDPGNWFECGTGTTATGRCSQRQNVLTSLRLGNSVYHRIGQRFTLQALSDGTETFSYRFGFQDSSTADSVDGCYFRYTHSVNSGNYELVCRSNSAETVTNAAVGPAAGVMQTIEVVVYPPGGTAEFFVDGTSAGTVTSNIPTGASRQTSIAWFILKSAGTTDRAVYVRMNEWTFWDNVPN